MPLKHTTTPLGAGTGGLTGSCHVRLFTSWSRAFSMAGEEKERLALAGRMRGIGWDGGTGAGPAWPWLQFGSGSGVGTLPFITPESATRAGASASAPLSSAFPFRDEGGGTRDAADLQPRALAVGLQVALVGWIAERAVPRECRAPGSRAAHRAAGCRAGHLRCVRAVF